METTRLGRTNLTVSRTAFGALPIQRLRREEAVGLLHRAREAGITFFDTARAYTDSEEKLGAAFGGAWEGLVVATKSGAADGAGLREDLETSLRNLQAERVDILQLHNPGAVPEPGASDGLCAALRRAREEGLVGHVGFTNHRRDVAARAVRSGLFETLQFPLNPISTAEDLVLIDLCAEQDVGVIAMKPLCGGLLTEARPAFAFLRQYANVVPIWGVQRATELEELLAFEADPPGLDGAMRQRIACDREELGGEFCRGCGYCLPCPAEIPIPMAARMALLLKRAPTQNFLTPAWAEKMERIEACTGCGQCAERCPYGLNPAEMLPENLRAFRTAYEQARG
jgi:aryl-alcohol dehydrogenase-like predicted oxidoreductase